MNVRDTRQTMTLWPPARRRVAVLTVAVAAVTATYAVGIGPRWQPLVAVAYVVAAGVAVASPPAIAAQVAVGVGLAWSVLPELDGVQVLALVPLVIGVVATAELLGLVARLRMVVERAPDMQRVSVAVTLAAIISGATLAAGLLDGPGGVIGTLLAASACVVLAIAFTPGGDHRPR